MGESCCLGRARAWGGTAVGLPTPGSSRELKPGKGLARAKQLAFEGHPKLLAFSFFFFPSFPCLSPHFSLLSAVSSSSITQTPNTSEEAVQLNLSRLQLAPERKVSSVREGEACARRSRSQGCYHSRLRLPLAFLPPSLLSPPLFNDTQWSVTPQQRERCPEASLWSGAIDQFFKKKR